MEASVFEFIQTNLLHVTPILIAGVIALTIFIERSRALYWIYPLTDRQGFFKKIRELVISGDITKALALCDKHPDKPLPRIIKKALLRVDQPEEMIASGVEIELEDAVQKVEKRTIFLSTIANVATLLGLLGTIAGLIISFRAVANLGDAQQKTELLAAGISQAMNHTLLGLSVAIPSLIVFAILTTRANRLVAACETASIQIMDIFRQRYLKGERSTKRRK